MYLSQHVQTTARLVPAIQCVPCVTTITYWKEEDVSVNTFTILTSVNTLVR